MFLPLQTQLELPPDAVVLIAVLHPAGETGSLVPQPQAALPSWSATSASASEENGAAAGGDRAATSQPGSSADSSPAPDPASGGDRAEDAEVAAANGVYYPSPVPEEDQDDEPAQGRREAAYGDDLLVGTFEVAFTEAARTKELTLNPPSVRRRACGSIRAVAGQQQRAHGLQRSVHAAKQAHLSSACWDIFNLQLALLRYAAACSTQSSVCRIAKLARPAVVLLLAYTLTGEPRALLRPCNSVL